MEVSNIEPLERNLRELRRCTMGVPFALVTQIYKKRMITPFCYSYRTTMTEHAFQTRSSNIAEPRVGIIESDAVVPKFLSDKSAFKDVSARTSIGQLETG
jgi:hypothetical protein